MAEKVRYPQIPGTVWWGVRAVMQRTPNATIDERLLGVTLGVQEAAAKAYINELRQVGILSEDNKPTTLAQKWRLDETYADAVQELVEATYPEGLVHVAPPGDADRQKIVSWFMREGLGQGAAGNKAATYLMISSPTPNEAPRAGTASGSSEKPARAKTSTRKRGTEPTAPEERARNRPQTHSGGAAEMRGNSSPDSLPLNINIQIHISADAGTEQIESIFQAMRRYLYDNPNS
jgi:hypothetical protein